MCCLLFVQVITRTEHQTHHSGGSPLVPVITYTIIYTGHQTLHLADSSLVQITTRASHHSCKSPLVEVITGAGHTRAGHLFVSVSQVRRCRTMEAEELATGVTLVMSSWSTADVHQLHEYNEQEAAEIDSTRNSCNIVCL